MKIVKIMESLKKNSSLDASLAPEIIWHSQSLREIYVKNYNNIAKIIERLQTGGALNFPTFASGLFPASPLPAKIAQITGMGDAWVRDNAMVAIALSDCGETAKSVAAAKALIKIFANAAPLMHAIVREPALANHLENCPPARVIGDTLKEHRKHHNLQNDSVGETLWLVAKLVREKSLALSQEDLATLKLMVEYLIAIEYWRCADNGAWEENLKVESSSIGAVLAGLTAFREIVGIGETVPEKLDLAIAKGRESLNKILPDESREPFRRNTDAAQIFLIEPLNIVNRKQAAQIVENISRKLLRDIGIARYENDAYWAPNYREAFTLSQRAQYSDDREKLAAVGGEAQWTLFDSLISVYYLKKFRENHEETDLARGRWHLERSLAQFVDTPHGWRLPEAFFLENGVWVPNDHVPLLWSQANVLRMLEEWKNSR